MAEYIEREAASIAACNGCNEQFGEEPCEPSECCLLFSIKTLPAADVVPVRHGRWEEVEIRYWDDMDEEAKEALAIASMFCPKCKRYHNEVYIYGNPTENVNYCPNCGAKMDGEA